MVKSLILTLILLPSCAWIKAPGAYEFRGSGMSKLYVGCRNKGVSHDACATALFIDCSRDLPFRTCVDNFPSVEHHDGRGL